MVKRKLLILCLGLAVLCLSSSLSPLGNSSVSASPDRLKWSIVDTPSEEGNVVLSPSEINALVVGPDGRTFYAVDIPNQKVYKSIDGGITWDDGLTRVLEDEGAVFPVWDIAVAPDDDALIAVVTNERQEVYVSEDGGDSWVDAHVSAATGWDADLLISDIAISPEYGDGNHDLAIGTRKPGGVINGDIWVLKSGPFASWEPVGLSMDVSSVAFSPGYGEEGVILAIASDTTGTYLCTRHKVGDEWKDVIPPVEISELSGNSPGEGEIIISDMALPLSDYSKNAQWMVYAVYYSTTGADDAYGIKHEADEEDARVRRLDIKTGYKVSLASIDYSGGKLLVGEVDGEAISASALIHICSNPEETFPDWEEPIEPPTGGASSGRANAQVAWGSDGEMAYCGTGTNYVTSANEWADMTFGPWRGEDSDESAFSRSEDGGNTWNQLSLIDTEMALLCDYALSTDYETIYLASVGGGFDSLWRSESDPLGETWQRILCFDSETDKIILRPTPEKSGKEAIFFAVPDSHRARYSLDKGETWKSVWDCPLITDLAVVSNEILYILDDNLVNKCTWNREKYGGIWEWRRDIDTGLLSGYTITLSGEDFVFVGEKGGEGKIAYSTNGGATFGLTEAVAEPGNMQVIPDEEFARNRFIYAASNGSSSEIYRWAIEGSTTWRELNPAHFGFCGLAQKGGALYGAYAYREGVARTLIPHAETVMPGDWDSLTVGLVSGAIFKPGSLMSMRDETVELWAIDDRAYDFEADTGCLWVYSDTFVLPTPWPTSPALGGLIPCDPCACQAEVFCFRWRELPLAEEYDLWIALDEKFIALLEKVENITPADLHSPAWCPLSSLCFGCGETYYWKVRACQSTEGETIHSRWSPPMHFTVKAGTSVGHMHIAPVLKVPVNGSSGVSRSPGFSWVGFPDTTKYEFILAKDAALTQIIIRKEVPTSAYYYSDKLDWGTTYFWQVKAVEPVLSESAIGTFTVMPEPPQPAVPTMPPKPAIPLWIWVVIGVLALLDVVIIVLCLVKR